MSQTLTLPGLPPVEMEWTPGKDRFDGPKLVFYAALPESSDLPDAIEPIENMRQHAIEMYTRAEPSFEPRIKITIERDDAYARWPLQVQLWVTIEGAPRMGADWLASVAEVMFEQVNEAIAAHPNPSAEMPVWPYREALLGIIEWARRPRRQRRHGPTIKLRRQVGIIAEFTPEHPQWARYTELLVAAFEETKLHNPRRPFWKSAGGSPPSRIKRPA